MQTTFTDAQLADPLTRRSNEILRSCVHCGFCTATCPTYKVLGDELDSPRGRIYLIKDMLENSRVPDEATVTHIDRCLSCLSCMTTCPSGVNYMHLVDHARQYIEETYTRPWHERMMRAVLTRVLPNPRLFRASLLAARVAKPLRALLPGFLLAVAERFGAQVSVKVAGQAVPVIGAAAGGVINVLFTEHFQAKARGHFIVRRLERQHGWEATRALYDRMAREQRA